MTQLISNQVASWRARLTGRDVRVAVLGMGYVGLPLAVSLAQAGFKVLGYDPQREKVRAVMEGRSPVQDIDDSQIQQLLDDGRLLATQEIETLQSCQIFLICVPTPLSRSKQPDLSYIEGAAEVVAQSLTEGSLVILESTTYPGTTEELLVPLLEQTGLQAGKDFLVAFSPERVDPGNPSFHTGNIPKLVGGTTPEATEVAALLYQTFLEAVYPVSHARVAELAKLHENTFRSVNIAYVNELAMLCETLEVNVWEVIDAAATKPFGFMSFKPGPGVGGHCIPLDPHYLAWSARLQGFSPKFIDLADQINSQMPGYVVLRLMKLLNQKGVRTRALSGAHVLVLGVTYKANVADARESPALDIIHELEKNGAEVRFIDPYVDNLPEFEGIKLKAKSSAINSEAFQWADVGLIITAHEIFDWILPRETLPLIFDTRGIYGESRGNVVVL